MFIYTRKKYGSGPKHVYSTRNFRRNVTNIGLSEVSQGYFDKSTCTSSALQRIRLLSPPTLTLAQITGTMELAPCLCYTTGIRYHTHKLLMGQFKQVTQDRLGPHTFGANILKRLPGKC